MGEKYQHVQGKEERNIERQKKQEGRRTMSQGRNPDLKGGREAPSWYSNTAEGRQGSGSWSQEVIVHDIRRAPVSNH